MFTVPTLYVNCPKCGWLHFAMREAEARETVRSFNEYYDRLTQDEKASYAGQATFEAYLRCFNCGVHTAAFVAARESDAPLGVTTHPVFVTTR
jgi:hypothetical protein